MLRLKAWDELPEQMQCDEVLAYYDMLKKRKASIALKRIFDIIVSVCVAIVLAIPMLIIAILIKLDSEGPVMFRQERVTTYGKKFRIYKFRTMVVNAEKLGAQVTTKNDSRITKVGHVLRKLRLDETPQVLNVITGDLSFVGTRPEVPRYVARYTPEMMATLLLPAGITSVASIKYKDEERLLSASENTDDTYVNEVLPGKMKYNLEYLVEFNILRDMKVMIDTVFAVIKKDEAIEEQTEVETVNV